MTEKEMETQSTGNTITTLRTYRNFTLYTPLVSVCKETWSKLNTRKIIGQQLMETQRPNRDHFLNRIHCNTPFVPPKSPFNVTFTMKPNSDPTETKQPLILQRVTEENRANNWGAIPAETTYLPFERTEASFTALYSEKHLIRHRVRRDTFINIVPTGHECPLVREKDRPGGGRGKGNTALGSCFILVSDWLCVTSPAIGRGACSPAGADASRRGAGRRAKIVAPKMAHGNAILISMQK